MEHEMSRDYVRKLSLDGGYEVQSLETTTTEVAEVETTEVEAVETTTTEAAEVETSVAAVAEAVIS